MEKEKEVLVSSVTLCDRYIWKAVQDFRSRLLVAHGRTDLIDR